MESTHETMSKYYDLLMQDVRMREGLTACMGCGVCTAVCPAAEFYEYDPRQIVSIVQRKNDDEIEQLMKSNTIWYCGECMSCRPRCPRNNTPGYIIQSLRTLSQKLGFFVESEKGRQQLAIKRTVGDSILATGYCLTPSLVAPEMHPEQGPVWEWINKHDKDVYSKFTPNYCSSGPGPLRRISDESMKELHEIFRITGGEEFFNKIEEYSDKKAREMGYDGATDEYFREVYTYNSNTHNHHN